LHEDVDHHPVLIYRTPELMLYSADLDEDFVQMPFRTDLLAIPSFQLVGEVGTELEAPIADRFIGEHNATLGHHQLDVSIAQAKAKIEPNAVRDNLARKP
jgi:hypothetical protein